MRYSIITINFNNREGLKFTIESVKNQTFKDFEFIIIDGGSTDGSVEVIKQHANHLTYWVSEKDNGIYNAMNKGVKIAKGDYCLFLNSGDYFYNNCVLEAMAKDINQEDLIIGKVITAKGTIVSPPPHREISFYHLFSGAIPHQGAFIKTELLKSTPYDENLKITADWKFFIQVIIFRNCSVKYTNEIITIYDTNGISSQNIEEMEKEKEEVLSTLIPLRIIIDYKWMKKSECKTMSLMPKLKMHYTIDRLMYKICHFILSITNK